MNFNTFSLNYFALASEDRHRFIRLLGLNDIPIPSTDWVFDRYCALDNDSVHITQCLPSWFGHASNLFDKTGCLIKSDACDWMKDYPVYLCLYDNQCGRYMATGYNATSKAELARDWIQYTSIDMDKDNLRILTQLNPQQVLDVAFEQGFEVEASETPFPDPDNDDED